MTMRTEQFNRTAGDVVWSTAEGHASARQRPALRAFSLVEVLLAIVILGIGVISIAALFPAGIAQQRLSNDDLMGPVVANHAISVIRAKVSQEDFGSLEEFYDGPDAPGGFFTRTVAGDWGWMRPSFFLNTDPSSNAAGAIDIFAHRRVAQVLGWSGANTVPVASEHWNGWPDIAGVPPNRRLLRGIPFNRDKHSRTAPLPGSSFGMPIPPNVTISQRERYYPMGSHLVAAQDPPQPQYIWDCMFRRYEGRIYVAVFVYRVSAPGGASMHPFVVQRNQSNPNVPPMPIEIDLTNTTGTNWPTAPSPDAWNIIYREDDSEPTNDSHRPLPRVKGFQPDDFDVLAEDQSWQAQRQWILDQNNDVHRVLSNRRPNPGEGDRMVIELTRPLTPVRLPFLPGLSSNPYENANDTTSTPYSSPFQNARIPSDSADEYFANPDLLPRHPDMDFPLFDRGVVTRFWYVPLRMEIGNTGAEFVLTPVYIAVKEL